MEISHDDGAADLRWKMRAKRSKRLPPPTADEISVAESLVLLALSGGGFCDPTLLETTPRAIFRPKKTNIIPLTAVNVAGTATSTAAKVKKKEELSPDTPLRNDHRCSVCGQTFHSFQALGGHMTTHRAKVANAATSDDRRRRNSTVGEGRGCHECSSCHEHFPTGQALGGHKRKHYDGPPVAGKVTKIKITFSKRGAGSSGGESSGGGATSRDVDRPIFDFDLNLPPPPED